MKKMLCSSKMIVEAIFTLVAVLYMKERKKRFASRKWKPDPEGAAFARCAFSSDTTTKLIH